MEQFVQKLFKTIMPIAFRSTVFISIRKFAGLQNNLAELGVTFMEHWLLPANITLTFDITWSYLHLMWNMFHQQVARELCSDLQTSDSHFAICFYGLNDLHASMAEINMDTHSMHVLLCRTSSLHKRLRNAVCLEAWSHSAGLNYSLAEKKDKT